MTVTYKDYKIYIKDENHTLVRIKINQGKSNFSKKENKGKEYDDVLGYFTSMGGVLNRITKDLIERDESTVDLGGYIEEVRRIKNEFTEIMA